MLLNYLYTNFMEETEFAQAINTPKQQLRNLITTRVFPAPSYVYNSNGQSISFIGTFTDTGTYRFHLQGHRAWHEAILQNDLTTESRARRYFFNRYEAEKKAFLEGSLGGALAKVSPEIPARFDTTHASSTWGYFLDGVYGVCTRDGQPETIFRKQICVMFIEHMTAGHADAMTDDFLALLKRAVTFLDSVESDFAPHEVKQTSRQRCIIDVKSKFLNRIEP